jgi:hypothetical protein
MANADARGRPIAPLVLSAQERGYLERQVRRHRVARSLSERCRVILRCADGFASQSLNYLSDKRSQQPNQHRNPRQSDDRHDAYCDPAHHCAYCSLKGTR